MQVDRRPNRGPHLAVLACLLALSLAIPIYWQSGTRVKPSGGADDDGLSGSFSGDFARMNSFRPFPAPNRSLYGSADTLDELLLRLSREQGGRPSAEPDLFLELIGGPESSYGVATAPQSGVVWQYLSAALRRAGRTMVEYSPGDNMASLVKQFTKNRPRPRRSEPLPTYSLLLGSPNDRIAMVPQQPQADVDAFPAPWCVPVVLVERLEVLAEYPYTAEWARETIDEIRALTASERPSASSVAAQLSRLESLAAQARELAGATDDDCLRAELLRAHWGLARRLECWSLMRDIVVASLAENRFAARVPWDAPTQVLSGQGSEPADLHSLSSELEAYERTRTPRLARAILQRQQLLAQANDARQRELADQIEQNYRNANLRLALSAEMLERFIPDQQNEVSPVRDRIAGTPVRGQSITSAENTVRLEPDASRWHVDLESDGSVASQTVAGAGQVKVVSRGNTTFSAQKSILVEHDGVRLGASTADARGYSRLVGIRSSFDWIPVVGEMVRSRAADEYRRKQPFAQGEVEFKVAQRVEDELDERADQAVDKMEAQFRDRVSGPLESSGVELTPIELSTTAERVIARVRVAGREQLAGHTPRPRAPSDSVASLQLHESAFTNAAVSLGLDGKRLTAPELQALMREKFSRTDQPDESVIEEDAVFEFAGQDAVRFRVADERLELVLALREVNYEGDPVRNFRVHAFYVPVIRRLEAELVRDGALGIEGRVRTGERARMHGVFNKVLGEDRRLPIVRLADPHDTRLAGLMITQLVLEDGWLGLAVGPVYSNRTAERTRMLR